MPFHTWTLETVRQRCNEDGDCWMWAQCVNSGGHPQASITGYRSKLVRRFAYEAAKGTILRGMVTNNCGRTLCCNPDHLVLRTSGQILAKAYETGRRSRYQRIRANPTLTPLQVAEIRDRVETSGELALLYGCSRSAVKDIRSGRTWKALGVSVFSWRP